MRIDKAKISEETKAKILQMLNDAEDKSQAIMEAMEMIASEVNQKLVSRIVEEARTVGSAALPQLSENEKKFFEHLKMGAKQSVTANQIDIIPVETVDKTLADIRTEYPILGLINFAPANVKHWLTGSKSGGALWGSLTSALSDSAELSATITGLNIEVSKLYAYCVIPKAIRDLEIGYVEKYFRAILAEAMYDGIAAGYINGDGKVAPVGILRKVGQTESDGTHSAKTVVSTLLGFSPLQMAPVLTTLSNGGKRPVRDLHVIANPSDVYGYINPALYGDSVVGGYVQKSFMPLTVIEEPNIAAGKAAITMPGYFTMGFSGMKVEEYKETKALDDADLLIAKVYGNGRADDDNTAFVFNPQNLVPYITKVEEVSNP